VGLPAKDKVNIRSNSNIHLAKAGTMPFSVPESQQQVRYSSLCDSLRSSSAACGSSSTISWVYLNSKNSLAELLIACSCMVNEYCLTQNSSLPLLYFLHDLFCYSHPSMTRYLLSTIPARCLFAINLTRLTFHFVLLSTPITTTWQQYFLNVSYVFYDDIHTIRSTHYLGWVILFPSPSDHRLIGLAF
jgi:hypothetical protein